MDNSKHWQLTETLRSVQLCCHLSSLLHNRKSQEFLLHGNVWPHTSVCTTETIKKTGWTVLPHHQIFTCWVLWKRACGSTNRPMMRHCRTLCASGCREKRALVTGLEYTLSPGYTRDWLPAYSFVLRARAMVLTGQHTLSDMSRARQ